MTEVAARSTAAARVCIRLKKLGDGFDEAISRMTRALEMFIVEGVFMTIPLHRKILADPDFRAGNFDTGFIERFLTASKKETAA